MSTTTDPKQESTSNDDNLASAAKTPPSAEKNLSRGDEFDGEEAASSWKDLDPNAGGWDGRRGPNTAPTVGTGTNVKK